MKDCHKQNAATYYTPCDAVGGCYSKGSVLGCSSDEDLGMGVQLMGLNWSLQMDANLGAVNWAERGLVDF